MSNHEGENKEIEASIEKECMRWLHDQLVEFAEVDFTDEELKEALGDYLKENNKSILDLHQEDKENIYADILQKYLEGGYEEVE